MKIWGSYIKCEVWGCKDVRYEIVRICENLRKEWDVRVWGSMRMWGRSEMWDCEDLWECEEGVRDVRLRGFCLPWCEDCVARPAVPAWAAQWDTHRPWWRGDQGGRAWLVLNSPHSPLLCLYWRWRSVCHHTPEQVLHRLSNYSWIRLNSQNPQLSTQAHIARKPIVQNITYNTRTIYNIRYLNYKPIFPSFLLFSFLDTFMDGFFLYSKHFIKLCYCVNCVKTERWRVSSNL